MLELADIEYRYLGTRTPALRGVSLTLGPGDVVGLVGASESGKSTLCLVAAGLAPRFIGGTLRGSVTLDEQPLASLPPTDVAGRIGIVFQDPSSSLTGVTSTVFEEVAFGPMNLGLPRDDVLARTEEALAALGIGELAARDPGHLSGGQRQLVVLAGVLALRPEYLILDEPTSELDPAGTGLVANAIAQLAAVGSAILIAEHKTDLLARICTRVIALAGGQARVEGPAAHVWEDPTLPTLGVDAPTSVRLAMLARGAGVDELRLRMGG
jgi:energy-coupling factor transporter ATP-binding protein EcfA2